MSKIIKQFSNNAGFIVITILLISYFQLSCEKGVEPEELKPGKRDYTWSVDTLQNLDLYKMWGSSSNNIWAVDVHNVLFYDGESWTPKGSNEIYGSNCVYGFSENNVWIGGPDGKIWHYNGSNWEISLSYKEETNYKYYDIIFYDIFGTNSKNIYAVGFVIEKLSTPNYEWYGIIMHYDGKKWERINIDLTYGAFRKIRKGKKTGSNYYILNYLYGVNGSHASEKYYEFNGKKLTEIYSAEKLGNDLTVIDDEVYFVFDQNIHIYTNNHFKTIIKNKPSYTYNSVYGRNRKDLFWINIDGIIHYNGTDFKKICSCFNQPDSNGTITLITGLRDGLVFDKSVVFLTHNSQTNCNYIFKGVLK